MILINQVSTNCAGYLKVLDLNLLSIITGDAYSQNGSGSKPVLILSTKKLSSILEFSEIKFFDPAMLSAICEYCLYQQVGSNGLQMVYSHASRLSTERSPLNKYSLRICSISYLSSEIGEEEGSVGPGCDVSGCPSCPRPSLG